MRNFPAQTGPGGEPVSDQASFTSSNANDVLQEEQNAITSSGQTLIPLANPANNTQLSQAMARYASGGVFGVDSGAADAYVVSVTGSFTVPDAYFDGMKVAFYAANASTGPSTINAFAIGVVDLVQQDGSALSAAFIDTVILTEAQYDSGAGKFFVTGSVGTGAGPIPVFTESFTSAEQTITAAGLLTIAHSLSGSPKIVVAELVCKTANLNYSIGDVVEFTYSRGISNNAGCSYVFDATNLVIRFGSSGQVFELCDKTTGATGFITAANWKIVFKAFF